MKITDSYKIQKEEFELASIKVPLFDDDIMKENTNQNPRWVHFGGGNLYRCFHAKIAQELLNQNEMDTGIIVVESFGKDLIEKVYGKNNCRSLSVVMNADGTFEKELIASTARASFINRDNLEELEFLSRSFENNSLQLVTMTITEKGYGYKDSNGEILTQVQSDIAVGPNFEKLQTTIAQLTYFLYKRFQKSAAPLALVSTDNFSHNGDRLKEVIGIVAAGWLKENHVSQDFYDYLFENGKISFPYSMIDRITPGPSEKVSKLLSQEGLEGMELITNVAGAPLAAFVNTEEIYYLAIEDDFPNGRPPLEKVANVFLANRDTVNKVDLMKVTTCLNPLHTTLAVVASLMGYTSIYESVKNEDLLKLIEKIGYDEGLKVVEDPGIINPHKFIDEVIYKRLMNPNIPDTPQRIATDTSQKLAIRFGETIQAYNNDENLDVKELTFIPFVIASWCKYLMGIDDAGNNFEPSPDPLYNELHEYVKDLGPGSSNSIHESLQPILSNREIFGMDLYEIGLADKIEQLFTKIVSKPFGVKYTLHELLKEIENGNDI